MRVLALVALLVAVPALSGCVCEPLMEIRFCRPAQAGCDPHPADVRTWSTADADAFPEVQQWMDDLEEGRHGHVEFTRDQELAFWQHWNIDPEDPSRQVFVAANDGIYRLRVLTCEAPR